jgi:hypothetical protein
MHRVRARPIWSDRTDASVAHTLAERRIQTDASGPTHRSTKFGSPMRWRGQACCLPVSSRLGLGPAWQWINGRELCWSKASRAAWPSVVPPVALLYAAALAACCAARCMSRSLQCRRLELRAGIQCHQVFLNRLCPASSCTSTLSSPFFPTVLLHTTTRWR